ncbi:MAG: SpaA isopeptide-forming pilin-related protein, partial [Alistipes sp.]|nr:SpaA isopeptide-forming pilin-related protein [Alistipes sp.]
MNLTSDYVSVKDGVLQVSNELIQVNVTVHKVSEKGNVKEPLSEVTFTLLDKDGKGLLDDEGNPYTGETDKNGNLTFKIPYGEYILKETQPKYHFLDGDGEIRLYLNDSTVEKNADGTYKLNADGTYNLKTVEITNERQTISISKKDSVTKKGITGAKLKLTSEDKNVTGYAAWESSENNPETFYLGGITDFENDILAPGTYTLEETEHPINYLSSDPISFEITEEGKIVVDGEDSGTQLVMYDEPCGNITVTKISTMSDINGDKITLSGAEFELWKETEDSTGKIKQVQVTDKEGNPVTGKTNTQGIVTFSSLPYGTYILKETKAPSGFIKREDDIRITVDKDVVGDIIVANTPQTKNADICIEKTVIDIDAIAQGLEFEFSLYKEGNFATPILVQKTGKTDCTATFQNIPFGTYYIREMGASEGYSSDPVSVTCNGDKLELYEPEDNKDEPKFYKITLSDENVVKDDSKPNDNPTITISVVDEKAKGKLNITKVELGTPKPIEGVRFTLSRKGENDVLGTYETDKDGKLIALDGKEKLEDQLWEYGDYVLTELDTDQASGYTFPVNYEFPTGENTTEVTINRKEIEVEISNKPKEGSFTIKKLDFEDPASDSDAEAIESAIGLRGARYYLYDVSAELINPENGELNREPTEAERIWVATGTTTGEKGTYQFNHIPYGTYYLKEEIAPLDYAVSSEYKRIVISDDSNDPDNYKDNTAPVRDRKLTATLTVQKVDALTDTVLADAEFTLKDDNGYLVKTDEEGKYVEAVKDTDENRAADGIKRTTNADGQIIYSELPYGNYVLTEEKAPVSYKITQKDHPININTPEPDPVVVKNENVMFQVSKRIKRGGVSDLEGATLQLLDSNDKVVPLPDKNGELQETWTTSSTEPKRISIGEGEGKVKPGTYTLKEVQAPDKYATAYELEFSVNGEGQLIATGEGFPLGKDGKPEGEIILENVLVMYDDVESAIAPKLVKISKASMDGIMLDGAELTILTYDEKTTVVPLWETSKTEPYTLRVGTEVDESDSVLLMYNEVYRLREETAPEGFKKAEEDIVFKINFDGQFEIISGVKESSLYKVLSDGNTHLTMLDAVEGDYQIFISKKAVGGTEELGGTDEEPGKQATLQITDVTGEVLEQWQTGTEPQVIEVGGNAKLQLQNTYWLEEIKAPNGYTETTRISFRVNSDGKIESAGEVSSDRTMLTIRDNIDEDNLIYISKMAIGGTNELPGAHFNILMSNPDGTDGAVVIEDLTSGEQKNSISVGDGENYQLQFNQVYILR